MTRTNFLNISLLILSSSFFSEAKLGAYRTKQAYGTLNVDPEVLKERLNMVDAYGNVLLPNDEYYTYQIQPSTKVDNTQPLAPSSTTTAVAELASSFQHALVAANRDDSDIHVGHLLSASDRLEATMRKIGFTQSANDIHGNVDKIRSLYNKAPENDRDSMPALLRYEMNSGALGSKDGRKIPEKSAAMGFLWLGRSINYQFDMFSHMLDNDADPYEAANVAYDRDLKPHLSWPLQKLCKAGMTTLKSRKQKEMFASIGGFSEECYGASEEQSTKRDLREMMSSLKPMLNRWKQVFTDLELGSI